MNKAMEVMLQYVENLKRTYEKDHAELMEFKKLANQNLNRCYGSSMESGGNSWHSDDINAESIEPSESQLFVSCFSGLDDGVPRTARSMSLTMGKVMCLQTNLFILIKERVEYFTCFKV